VAMIAGSLVAARRGVADDRIGVFARTLIAAGLGFVLAASYPSLVIVIVGVVLALGAAPMLNAAISTVFHERVPASMQGRVFGLRTSIGRSLEPIGAVAAGFTVAHVAIPAMRDGGSLSGTVGRLIGSGEGRGAALVLGLVGLVLLMIGVWLWRTPLRDQLRVDGATPGDDAAADDSRQFTAI